MRLLPALVTRGGLVGVSHRSVTLTLFSLELENGLPPALELRPSQRLTLSLLQPVLCVLFPTHHDFTPTVTPTLTTHTSGPLFDVLGTI